MIAQAGKLDEREEKPARREGKHHRIKETVLLKVSRRHEQKERGGKKQEEQLDRAGCDADHARAAEKEGEREKKTPQASPFLDGQRKGQDVPVRRIETVDPCISKAMQQKCHEQHSRAADQVKEVHMFTLHSFAGYLTIQIETVPSDKRL